MLPRFHALDFDLVRRGAVLGADEARHLTKVMRLGVGDEVVVFDGRGLEFRARVEAVASHTVRLGLLEPLSPAPEARVALTLVQAILKGDRMDDVVRDATMMGVTAIVPVMTSHVAVRTSTIDRGRPADRWRRVALASAKQSRRATLPDVQDPRPFRDWLATPVSGVRLLFVEPDHPSAAAPRSLSDWLDRPAPAAASLVVGPEGGWAPEEYDAALAAACTPVTLGALTLRADAVPMAAIAICRFVFQDLQAPPAEP